MNDRDRGAIAEVLYALSGVAVLAFLLAAGFRYLTEVL